VVLEGCRGDFQKGLRPGVEASEGGNLWEVSGVQSEKEGTREN